MEGDILKLTLASYSSLPNNLGGQEAEAMWVQDQP